jgi:Ca2+-binding RTX toxin-like protein
MDIQDVTAINIVSNGNPTTATAATAENAFTLVGDATSITLTGDTHIDTTLNIDASGALANAARAVTVDASGMTGTAYVELEAGASTLVSYTMTGTANADTLAANAAGSSMTAGAGADTITGGAGADTIIGGDGIDTVTPGAGADSLTLGAGADIVIMGAIDVTAVAQVSTHAASLTLAANDSVIVTVGTVAKTYALSAQDVTGNATLDAVELEANLANFINSSFTGVTAAITGGDLVITADTTVDATPTVTLVETTAGNGVIADTATTAGVDAVAVATTVTDFDTSAAGDVIHIDVSVVEGHAGVTKLSDGDGNVAAGDTVVILDYTVGTAFSDTDGVADGQNVIKAAYSSTLNSAANFDAAYNANTITLDNALADNDAITAVFYDADSSQAVLGFILQANSDGAVIDDDATFNEIGRFTMTQADYTLLNADDFAFI